MGTCIISTRTQAASVSLAPTSTFMKRPTTSMAIGRTSIIVMGTELGMDMKPKQEEKK
jgi:hypothetical protein